MKVARRSYFFSSSVISSGVRESVKVGSEMENQMVVHVKFMAHEKSPEQKSMIGFIRRESIAEIGKTHNEACP